MNTIEKMITNLIDNLNDSKTTRRKKDRSHSFDHSNSIDNILLIIRRERS
ncbi:hypothetical protein ACQVQE_10185 [Bacillus mycoides]